MSEVIYLSDSAPVHMGDEWFEIANLEHFWIKRRFDVLRKLGRAFKFHGKKIGEIGCGSGLVQKQMEDYYGVTVDGFDLNANALRKSHAIRHARFCYNIFDCNSRFAGHYDLLVLFDVLEHIEHEMSFLDAVLYHLKPGGQLLINVPALMTFYSAYDKAVGHQRRYTARTLERLCDGPGLKRIAVTYWGLPMIPLLFLRNLRVAHQTDPRQIIKHGYKPPGQFANRLLGLWSTLEPIPQRLLGSSLMAFYRKE